MLRTSHDKNFRLTFCKVVSRLLIRLTRMTWFPISECLRTWGWALGPCVLNTRPGLYNWYQCRAASPKWRFFASQNSNNNIIEKADRNDLRVALALRMAPVPSKTHGQNLTSTRSVQAGLFMITMIRVWVQCTYITHAMNSIWCGLLMIWIHVLYDARYSFTRVNSWVKAN